MEKTTDIINNLTSNIVEYIRYILVGGISLLSIKIYSKELYLNILNEKLGILIFILIGFGIVLFFINKTFYFQIFERLTDWNNNVFRSYIRKKYGKMKFFRVNDLWVIIQDEEKICGELNKYKLWKASIEMMSGLSLFFIIIIMFGLATLNITTNAIILYLIFFILSFLSSLKSNINLEIRLYNIFKYKNIDGIEEKIKIYIEKTQI